MHRHCGLKDPKHVESEGDFFRVTFKSNGRFDGTGFRATYEFRTTKGMWNMKRIEQSNSNLFFNSSIFSSPEKEDSKLSLHLDVHVRRKCATFRRRLAGVVVEHLSVVLFAVDIPRLRPTNIEQNILRIITHSLSLSLSQKPTSKIIIKYIFSFFCVLFIKI